MEVQSTVLKNSDTRKSRDGRMNIALCVGEEPKMEIPLTSICWFIVSFPSPCSYLIYFCSCRTLSTSVMERQIWEKNKNRVFSFENNGKVFSTLRMNYDSTFPVPSFEVHMELGMVCHQSASPNNLPLTSMPQEVFPICWYCKNIVSHVKIWSASGNFDSDCEF